ncbi:hypothetical protein M514_27843 [Trichuris suis]|uniref:Uncharacterized protein n=1 Tax=Trichuris suis TaxID=68888 RepID=A0A085MRX5_9BILA|nr:hypothetical protein M514_27843 [Trichuris suis]
MNPNQRAALVGGKRVRTAGQDGSDVDSASIETAASSLPEDMTDEKHDQQVLIEKSREFRPHSDGKSSKAKDTTHVFTTTSVKRRSRLF